VLAGVAAAVLALLLAATVALSARGRRTARRVGQAG
jgi:hypothetical protein